MAWFCFLSIAVCLVQLQLRSVNAYSEPGIVWIANYTTQRQYTYNSVDLAEVSLLVRCSAQQFKSGDPNDGDITFRDNKDVKRFRWQSFKGDKNVQSVSRMTLECTGDDFKADVAQLCWKPAEQSTGGYEVDIKGNLPNGHCENDLNMVFSKEKFKILCGNAMTEVDRLYNTYFKEKFQTFNVGVSEFKETCATRLRPINSEWVDALTGDSVTQRVNLEGKDLVVHWFRDSDKDTYTLTLTLQRDSDGEVFTVVVEAPNSTTVKLHSTVRVVEECEAKEEVRTVTVEDNTGTGVEILISYVNSAFVVVTGNLYSEAVRVGACSNTVGDVSDMALRFLDSTTRNLGLFGNTNFKIVDKVACNPPGLASDTFVVDGDSETSYPRFTKIQGVRCKDPSYEISHGGETSCNDPQIGWIPQLTCTLKACVPGEELNVERDQCVKCSGGRYSVAGGPCELCPANHYASTDGSVECKECENGIVDTQHLYCLTRPVKPTVKPTESRDGGGTKKRRSQYGLVDDETKRAIYIAMGVGLVLHLVVGGIVACITRDKPHGDKSSSDYFTWRFNKYNTKPKIVASSFSKKEPEISIQYTFPEALLALEGEKKKEGGESSRKPSNRSDSDNQAQSSQHDQDEEEEAIVDPLYDDIDEIRRDTLDPSTKTPGTSKSTEHPSQEEDTDSLSLPPCPRDEDIEREDPNYLAPDELYPHISSIPFPGTSKDTDSDTTGTRKRRSTLIKDDERRPSGEEGSKSTLRKIKTFKDMALGTLKKDATLKKDLTQKKSSTLKKESTLRRNTMKKEHEKVKVEASKRKSTAASELDKEFADIADMLLQFEDWTEKAPEPEPKPEPNETYLEVGMDYSYSDDTYAVMEYEGDPIIYEDMKFNAPFEGTYDRITSISRKDEHGIERYVSMEDEDGDGSPVYTLSTKLKKPRE